VTANAEAMRARASAMKEETQAATLALAICR